MQTTLRLVTGAAVTALVFSKVVQLAEQDHSFSPSSGTPTRQARFAQYQTSPGQALKQLNLEFFLNKSGLYIHYRTWVPLCNVHPTIKGIVILVHGLGEHIARYQHVAQALVQAGFIVYGLDHQGHGRSEGDRLHVGQFSDFVDDVLELVKLAKRENPTVSKTFLFGHSMGGLISLLTLQRAQHEFVGAVISGPALQLADPVPAPVKALLSVISATLPKLTIDGLGLDSLVNYKPVLDLYLNDPLVAHIKIPARLLNEIMDSMQMVKPSTLSLPYLLIHGRGDKICRVSHSQAFHDKTTSTDRTFQVFEGGHETLNEIDGAALAACVNWLKARI